MSLWYQVVWRGDLSLRDGYTRFLGQWCCQNIANCIKAMKLSVLITIVKWICGRFAFLNSIRYRTFPWLNSHRLIAFLTIVLSWYWNIWCKTYIMCSVLSVTRLVIFSQGCTKNMSCKLDFMARNCKALGFLVYFLDKSATSLWTQ